MLQAGHSGWVALASDLPFVGSIGPGALSGLILLALVVAGALCLARGYLYRLDCTLYVSVYAIFTMNCPGSGYQTFPVKQGVCNAKFQVLSWLPKIAP